MGFNARGVIEMMAKEPAQAMGLIRSLIIRLRISNRKWDRKSTVKPAVPPEYVVNRPSVPGGHESGSPPLFFGY